MDQLNDYLIFEKIYEGPRSTIFKGKRIRDQIPVIIKSLSCESPEEEELNNHLQDFGIGKSIQHENVITYLELIPFKDGYAIIEEDFNAQSLKQYAENNPLPLSGFLNIICQVVKALEAIHLENVVHKDVKPSNILINPMTGLVKVIDFSISSKINREVDYGISPEDLRGTLPYVSPEQTGRVNRPVDFRSDFYSLGITCYFLLTGELPFKYDDPSKIIHAHIARYPVVPSIINPKIPKPVSGMVMKLISKDAEDRYQSWKGLLSDLEKCKYQLAKNGAIADFELGMADFSDNILLSQKLYGRDSQLTEILQAFDRIDHTTKEVFLLTGEQGLGKSFLLKQIRNSISFKQANVIKGEYEKSKSHIPYSGIIAAFGQAVRGILTGSDKTVSFWRKKLKVSLGINAQIIAEVIPGVTAILGEKLTVPDLAPMETQNRFLITFLEFVKLFCRDSNPLVLFLDNLHVADEASIYLLEKILVDPDIQNLLFIGAFEGMDFKEDFVASRLLGKLQKEKIRFKKSVLSPVTVEQIAMMIDDSMHCGTQKSNELAQLVFLKTGGNFFFVKQFITKLYKDQQLHLTRTEDGKGVWQFDTDRIKKQKMTDNMVNILLEKWEHLPESTTSILKTASCIGSEFELNLLALTLQTDQSQLLDGLFPAIEEQIITVVETVKQPTGVQSDPVCRFVHPRLLQTASASLEDKERQEIHHKIGRCLLNQNNLSPNAHDIYQIAHHLNLGVQYLDSPEEKVELAKINLQSGKKAKQSSAYEQATAYLQNAVDMLNEVTWINEHNLCYSINFELAETLYLRSDFERMEVVLIRLYENANSLKDKTMVDGLRMEAYIARNMMTEASKLGRTVLKSLGFSIPRKPGKVRLILEIVRTRLALLGKKSEDLLNMPEIKDERTLLTLQIIRQQLMAVFVLNPFQFVVIILKVSRLFAKRGISAEFIPFTYYGFILCGILHKYEEGYRYGSLGLEMLKRYPDCRNKASIIHVFNVLMRYWKDHLRVSLPGIMDGYRKAVETGQLEIAANSLSLHDSISLNLGHNLVNLEKEIRFHFQQLKGMKHQSAIEIQALHWQTALNLIGESKECCSLKNSNFDEVETVAFYKRENNTYGLMQFYTDKVTLEYLFRNHQSVVDLADDFLPLLKNSPENIAHVLIIFYHSLSLLALYNKATKTDRKKYLKAAKSNLRKLKRWSDTSPENFLHKYHLIKAEISRVTDNRRAIVFYRKSIDEAKKQGYINEQAIATECLAKHWLYLGERKVASVFMTEAFSLYKRWGAHAKAKDLESNYPDLTKPIPQTVPGSLDFLEKSTDSSSPFNLDFHTLLEAIRAISAEMVFDKLIDKIIKIIIKNSGAQKGLIIRKEDKRLIVEIAVKLEDSEIITLPSSSLDLSGDFCQAIVNLVLRSGEDVILENANKQGFFANDPYIHENSVKSVLCTPVRQRGKISGVLYLENHLVEAAFSKNRIVFIQALLAQATVSMENARLYEKTVSIQRDFRKSEDKYKMLVENTGAIVIHLSLDGIALFVNSTGAELYSEKPENMVGLSVFNLFKSSEKILKARIEKIIKTGEGAVYEDYMELPKGNYWFIANYQPVKDETGKVIALQITSQNISELKEAEEQLKRLSVILEATSDFVSFCSPDLTIQYINSAGKKMIGLDDEINPVNIEVTTVHPKWAEKIIIRVGIPTAINEGIWRGETALKHRDGSEIPTSQVIMAHRSETGKLQYISTIIRDVSEQKKTEKKLKKYQKKLKGLVEERTSELKTVQIQLIEKAHKAGMAEIAAGTLHNVGNLLNSVKTSANTIESIAYHSALSGFLKANELLRQKMDTLEDFILHDTKGVMLMEYYLKLEEALVEENGNIKKDIKRLNEKIDIISDVIAAQQTYAGIESLTEECSLATIIEDALTLESGMIDRYGIKIAKEYDDIPLVPIQKTKLIHVLINLINNARDAMMDLDAIDRRLVLSLAQEDKSVIMKVRDNGKGIQGKHLNKIFTHGFTTKEGGHGFGLHSSANFMMEMNGRMSVESEGEGKGTTFILKFPLAAKAKTQIEERNF
ncbi:AAA family ATPase [bacterium]|nr:AAA family ATPase [bacterium]